MGHDGRVVDQALHTAQGLGQGEDLNPLQHPPGALQIAVDQHRDHAAEAAVHLARGQFVLRVADQARIDDLGHAFPVFQPAGHGHGVLVVRLHAQAQGLQPPVGQEGVERPHDAADGVLQELQLGRHLGVLGHQNPADDVGVAVQILGRRVHDHVGAQGQRLLAPRRGEGVVDHQDQLVRLGDLRQGLDVGQLHQRVGGGLDPQHPRLVGDRCLDCLQVGQVDIAEVQPHRPTTHPLEQPPRAAVQVVAGDDVRPGVQQLQRRRGRRHARAEAEGLNPALQIGDAGLEGLARRVLAARILIALVHARAFLGIGRGGVDRRHHRARGRVGLLAGVDGAGRETLAVLQVGHGLTGSG